jgi:hypothetical protein
MSIPADWRQVLISSARHSENGPHPRNLRQRSTVSRHRSLGAPISCTRLRSEIAWLRFVAFQVLPAGQSLSSPLRRAAMRAATRRG